MKFESAEAAQLAITNLTGYEIEGRAIQVSCPFVFGLEK